MTALLIFLTALLVGLNGFFVIAEYALVRSRRARLEQDIEEGARGARLALHQIDEINEYVSTIQVGITMASIGIGAIGEPAFANLLEDPLGGALSHAAAVALAVVLAYLIITSWHIIAGELVPKYYAIGHAEGVARRTARPLELFIENRSRSAPRYWMALGLPTQRSGCEDPQRHDAHARARRSAHDSAVIHAAISRRRWGSWPPRPG